MKRWPLWHVLHSLDGREDVKEFSEDDASQGLKPVDGLTDEHQHVGRGRLVTVSQELQ